MSSAKKTSFPTAFCASCAVPQSHPGRRTTGEAGVRLSAVPGPSPTPRPAPAATARWAPAKPVPTTIKGTDTAGSDTSDVPHGWDLIVQEQQGQAGEGAVGF